MSEKNEALIRSALKDGCRAHCDELIDELRRLSAENERLAAEVANRNRRALAGDEAAATAQPQEPCNKSCAPGYCYCEPAQEPVAWATVCDGVIDSCSLTKTAAKLKAENLRDRNRGRNFVFGVRPLSYSTQRKPLTDDQKQAIHNETGAGHALICLVESYINGIEESNT